MTSWLTRHRKQQLLDLSSEAGLEQDEDSRKDELVEALDDYLQQNSTRLSRNPTFEGYYGMRRTPYKVRGSSGITAEDVESEVKSIVRGRGRRATKIKQEEFDDMGHGELIPLADSDGGLISPVSSSRPRRTPGRPPRQSRLPASPADVADLAEYETTQIYAGLNDMYSVSGIPEGIDALRDYCSSVTGVQLLFLFIETAALQRELIPWTYLTDITFLHAIGLPAISVYVPSLFVLLESSFWFPTLLWGTTSLIIPTLFAYFFNLTIREVKRHGAKVSVARYNIDPLTFNVVKAILTWTVYAQGFGAEWIGPISVGQITDAMVGGAQGVLTGCGIVVLMSLYEAAQRK